MDFSHLFPGKPPSKLSPSKEHIYLSQINENLRKENSNLSNQLSITQNEIAKIENDLKEETEYSQMMCERYEIKIRSIQHSYAEYKASQQNVTLSPIHSSSTYRPVEQEKEIDPKRLKVIENKIQNVIKYLRSMSSDTDAITKEYEIEMKEKKSEIEKLQLSIENLQNQYKNISLDTNQIITQSQNRLKEQNEIYMKIVNNLDNYQQSLFPNSIQLNTLEPSNMSQALNNLLNESNNLFIRQNVLINEKLKQIEHSLVYLISLYDNYNKSDVNSIIIPYQSLYNLQPDYQFTLFNKAKELISELQIAIYNSKFNFLNSQSSLVI